MRESFFSKSSVFLTILLVVVLTGCATSKSGTGDDGPSEIQGNVPSGAEAEFHAPPKGPEVLSPKHVEKHSVDEDSVESGVIQRAALNQLIARGPGYVFSQVETKAVHAGPTFVGFELVAISPSAQQAVGSRVHVGDVITHLNGVQQRLPDDYLRAWKMLGDASHVRIDLIRAGQSEQVIWRVE